MEYLPSKEFFKKLAIVICLIAIISLIGIFYGNKSHFATTSKKGDLTVVKDIVEKDTDADGLPDWQETLWGFNPKKVDTNDDGKTDLEEARILQTRLAEQNKEQVAEADIAAKTETGKFATDFVQLVTSLYQSGNLSNEDVTVLTQKVEEYIKTMPPEKVYSLSELTIVPLDYTSAENYLESLDAAFKKYPIDSDEFENLVISIHDYLETEEGVIKLTSLSKKYAGLRDALLAIKIPQGADKIHLEVINAVNQMSETFLNMTFYETDSLRALAGLVQFEDKVNQLSQSMISLEDLIFNS